MFSVITPDDENAFQTVLRQIKLRKNGVVADSMKDSGLLYAVNFGVSIVDLRKLAQPYKNQSRLAAMLWEKGWRETYILATMVADPKTLSIDLLETWTASLPTTEISEQMGNNLFSEIDNPALFAQMLHSEHNLKRLVVLKAFARRFMLKNLKHSYLLKNFLETNLLLPEENRLSMAIALGQALGFYIRNDNDLINYFQQKIAYFATLSENFNVTLQILKTEVDGLM